MTPDDLEKLMQTGANAFDERMRRPRECSELEMELKTAIELKDVACCRELLRDNGQWLAQFKGHELAELMDTAIGTGEAADEIVSLLLQSGVPAHSVFDRIGPDYQHTPLVTAAKLGRLDLIQKLAAAGADVFWASPSGANALSEIFPSKARQASTADSQELALVRDWLTQQGLQMDPLCADSRRKLRWSSAQPASWQDVPALLVLGIPLAETGWTPFMLELALGVADVRTVASLAADELNHRDEWKRTPFLLAVTAGDLEMARALFERGSDLFATGHCGATALHLAAEYNYCPMLEWLLACGFPLDVRNEFGNSALHDAVRSNAVDAAALLLNKGADVHERDANGYALIHAVTFKDHLAMLNLLLNAGADVNDVSGGGSWPLQQACQSGNADAVAFLLQLGANPNLTSTGETALFAAVSDDSLECVRLLLDAGADVNAMDCDGWTCLFHLRSERVAHYLLEHGANPSLSDQCGGLPEDWERVPMAVRQMLYDCRTRIDRTRLSPLPDKSAP
jgi:ankyrin repeat protein